MNGLKNNTPGKWTQYLLYLALGQLALSVMGMVLSLGSLIQWLNVALTTASALCLFGLTPLNPRMRQAAIFQLMSACAMAGSALVMLTLVGAICSLVATYQAYAGFSEVVTPADGKLGKAWKRLFLWQLLSGLLVGMVSAAIGIALTMLLGDATELYTQITVWGTNLLGLVLDGVYAWYLLRTIRLFESNAL